MIMMMEAGKNWLSCAMLSTGHYSGTGTIGPANIQYLIREFDTRGEDYLLRRGAHSHKQLWLPDTEANRELIEGLERDYPLLSEEEHSRVEIEWESEMWSSWLKNDLIRALPDELGEVVEDDLDDDELFSLYRDAMERENEYPIYEDAGCTVRIDRIQDTFSELVIAELMRKGELS